MIKLSTHQEDNNHRHALSIGGPQYIKQIPTDLKGERDNTKRF